MGDVDEGSGSRGSVSRRIAGKVPNDFDLSGSDVASRTRVPDVGVLSRAKAKKVHRGFDGYEKDAADGMHLPDVGILSRAKEGRELQACVDWVNCTDGMVNLTTTCAEACGTDCCYGDYACDDFTGQVCKDGVSCTDLAACANAAIEYVHLGCNGNYSCTGAGSGNLGVVYNGCHGYKSCYYAGSYGGNVSSVVNSCDGLRACWYMGVYGGAIGPVVGSCIGYEACLLLGGGDSIHDGGYVGYVYNSCLDVYACYKAAAYGGSIDNITSSCLGNASCNYLAAYDGDVGLVANSCYLDYGCYLAGSGDGGMISGIIGACNGIDSCREAGRFANGTINSVMYTCCNGERECVNATDGSLPPACAVVTAAPTTASPTNAPTSSPTDTPTRSPTGRPTNAPTAPVSKYLFFRGHLPDPSWTLSSFKCCSFQNSFYVLLNGQEIVGGKAAKDGKTPKAPKAAKAAPTKAAKLVKISGGHNGKAGGKMSVGSVADGDDHPALMRKREHGKVGEMESFSDNE